MTRGTKGMRSTLIAQRDELLRQREALDNQIEGLELAISLVSGEETIQATKPGGRRANNKGIVLKLLEDVGTSGLNAAIADDLASKRGVSLDRNSVSSLLSRLKSENVVEYDGDRYRLVQFSKETSTFSTQGPGDVLNFEPRRSPF